MIYVFIYLFIYLFVYLFIYLIMRSPSQHPNLSMGLRLSRPGDLCVCTHTDISGVSIFTEDRRLWLLHATNKYVYCWNGEATMETRPESHWQLV